MKYVQNLLVENYKTIMKYIKESLSKFRAMHCFLIRRLSIVKVSISPICYLDSMQSHSKSQELFFVDINKMILKLIWKGKARRIAKIILKKEKNVGGFILSNFKTLWSYSSEDSVVLVDRVYTQRSKEQNTEARNRPIQIQSSDFWQKWKGKLVEKRYCF